MESCGSARPSSWTGKIVKSKRETKGAHKFLFTLAVRAESIKV